MGLAIMVSSYSIEVVMPTYNGIDFVEAQIASISDDIAYNSHDLQDGVKAGLFRLEDLLEIPVISETIYKHKKKA